MKQILLAVAFLLVLASIASAQERQLPQWIARDKTFHTNSWDSVFVTDRDYQTVRMIVSHDSGASPLIVARQDDTTGAHWIKIHASQVIPLPPVNNAHWIRIKADTANVHARFWIF